MMRVLALVLALAAGHAQALPVTKARVVSGARTIPLSLEVAATPDARQTGLMKRKTLAPLDGMAFFWPAPQEAAFWMKNTMIPLDILFVGADGRIRHIAANTTPYSLEPIQAGAPYSLAIELDGGRAAREAIRVGDAVQIDLPKELRVE